MKKNNNKERLEGQRLPDEQVEASLPAPDVNSPNPPVDAEEEAADIVAPSPSNRNRLQERLAEKYPSRDFSNDEDFYGAINDELDDNDNRLNEYRESEKALSDMFKADPKSAHFFLAWKSGKDPFVELVRRYGDKFKDALDDPERIDALAEAHDEYVKNSERNKQLEAEYEENMVNSLKVFEDYQNTHNLDDEQVDAAIDLLVNLSKDAILGKFTEESFDMAVKALSHDNDVAMAENVGEVRGRNARISEKLRKPEQGDGMANVGGSNSGVRNMPRRGTSIFERAAMAK